MAKKIGSIILLILAVIFLVAGYRYISYRDYNAVSDAAFIKSDRLSTLSFKVGGKVVKMYKSENDSIKKGDLMAIIDPVDLENAKDALMHQIDALYAKIEAAKVERSRLKQALNVQAQIAKIDISAISKQIKALIFQIKAQNSKLRKIKTDDARYARILKEKLIAKSDYESIHTQMTALSDQIKALEEKSKVLDIQRIKAKKAYRLSQIDKKRIKEMNHSIKSLLQQQKAMQSNLKEVKNKIGYTKIYAPFDAIVAKKFIDAPRIVKKGSPIYAVTDPKSLYCEVLLSEKKIHGVHPGSHAVITVDAIENKKFKAEVESIAPTSASTFSLVPRDIASGEFTKLDQRFSIRIKLQNIEGLRAGMGATVAIKRD